VINLRSAIKFTMKGMKSMKIGDLGSVGGFTCRHLFGDEANEFSEPFFPSPFMFFKCFMVNNPGFHNFNCGISD
jgi:hypothetical protein